MKSKSRIAILCSAALFTITSLVVSSCSSSGKAVYIEAPDGPFGSGYSSGTDMTVTYEMFDANAEFSIFVFGFTANIVYSAEDVANYVLYRASEITISNGYDYFVELNREENDFHPRLEILLLKDDPSTFEWNGPVIEEKPVYHAESIKEELNQSLFAQNLI